MIHYAMVLSDKPQAPEVTLAIESLMLQSTKHVTPAEREFLEMAMRLLQDKFEKTEW